MKIVELEIPATVVPAGFRENVLIRPGGSPFSPCSLRLDDESAQHFLITDAAGADGFVCSPEEVRDLASMPWVNPKIFVTPGVRSAGEAHGDQKRVSTPADAVKAGATHLVVGRQVLGATDPVDEVKRVLAEISGG